MKHPLFYVLTRKAHPQSNSKTSTQRKKLSLHAVATRFARTFYFIVTAGIITASMLLPAAANAYRLPKNPFVLGAQMGGGEVSWGSLIATDKATGSNWASNPTQAGGGGIELGAYGGIFFTRYFGLQTTLNHYPTRKITFNSSIAGKAVNQATHDNIQTGNSSIYTVSIDDIFSVPVWRNLSAYAVTGVGFMSRNDPWVTAMNVGGHFGCGTKYQFKKRYVTQLNFDYYTGNGKATEHPIDSYFPFLYSINVGLGVRL